MASAPGHDVDRSVDSWAVDVRVDAARDRRRREHWLRRQAADDVSLTGVLVDLAEGRRSVRLTTLAGNEHHGRLQAAGHAVVVLDVGTHRVVVATDAVVSLHTTDGPTAAPSPLGHRGGTDATTLADLLSHAAADGPETTLVARSGLALTGELVSVGRDVVVVRPERGAPLVYVALASVSEAVLPLSTSSG